ncbi:hypothetical protein MRB53_007268 [Persea americana]|uniref:Uncharacterized protein n=1 Tax=Persea americana TaxID=3435 RepID=A0ACC2MII1_PERAE|nr:hypothetical protein MRB53_007268 [Persea americana]|eukprot:TRINITY_DN22583_c0_g1_i1.p1 TRINITY_DN22583_c0_g1~~TRINITY_DN22583_c0_g1_i1.p1  ORF type:complete len:107 (+),score=14.57 TRINITY_DN22583_c0_g1_i1:18-338(+)
MEQDSVHRRPLHFSGCIASPSWIPSRNDGFHFHLLNGTTPRSRRWRNLLKRLVKEGKNMYGSKPPLTFRYDEDSYSQNFDEGSRNEESDRRSRVSKDLRWHATQIK